MADAAGCALLTGITLYAVLGGADFGGGLWDLLAGGDRRGRPVRQLIDDSISPVWEANHVWLVFDLVIFWTGFPHVFAAVMTTAALPLWLALAGIVLRGSGFVFRDQLELLSLKRAAGATFALSSLVTPFFMGTVVGAVASGNVPADASRASVDAWTNPTALLAGFLFVAACAYLAAVYLAGEAERRNAGRLQAYFALRGRIAAIAAGALSLALLAELHGSNPVLYSRLTGRSLTLVIVAGLCGAAVVTSLSSTPARPVRLIAALGVAAVIWGWGVAQYPQLLPGTTVTLTNAGAPYATLIGLVGVLAAAIVLIAPSFALLYILQEREVLHAQSAPWHPNRRKSRPSQPPTGAGPSRHAAGVAAVLVLAALISYLRDRRREY